MKLQCCPFITQILGSIEMYLKSELCYKETILQQNYLRNEFDFWNVHRIMNTWGLLQSK